MVQQTSCLYVNCKASRHMGKVQLRQCFQTTIFLSHLWWASCGRLTWGWRPACLSAGSSSQQTWRTVWPSPHHRPPWNTTCTLSHRSKQHMCKQYQHFHEASKQTRFNYNKLTKILWKSQALLKTFIILLYFRKSFCSILFDVEHFNEIDKKIIPITTQWRLKKIDKWFILTGQTA